MSPEFAYLLGMITGKGSIKRNNKETEVSIEIPHKILEIEGMETEVYVNASILDIKRILDPFLETTIEVNSQAHRTIFSFSKNNKSYVIRELNKHFNNLSYCYDFRIPLQIFGESADIKKEFLRGIADVTGYIRKSNLHGYEIYGSLIYGHRVYIEIPVNWFLAIDISNLLKNLDIPVQNINWGHPNTRDPNLKDYNKGKKEAWFREHQIKIYAEEFEKIGFNIIHKKKTLQNLANENRKNWDIYVTDKINQTSSRKELWKERLGRIDLMHHRYYWEINPKIKEKPVHPMENDKNIPKIIRGRHFNSWREIAEALGYKK
jgi:hypothetical protein